MSENITLGSGNLYVAAFTDTIPADATLEVEGNLIGRIKGGAELTYTPEEYETADDGNNVQHRFVIKESAELKSGVMTWDMETLHKLSAAGSYEDDDEEGIRTLTLGGKGAREMTKWVVRFVHQNGKFRVTLVATASAGFTLGFRPDTETVIDATWKAVAHGANGALVILTETYEVEEGGE